MTKHFKELVLTKDTIFNESIEVEGSITCKDPMYFSLKVIGNINAWDIDAGDIDAWDINAWDIDARDINARDINAGNINAWDIDARDINAGNIICEKRIKKQTTNKTIARVFIQNKSTLEKKEQM